MGRENNDVITASWLSSRSIKALTRRLLTTIGKNRWTLFLTQEDHCRRNWPLLPYIMQVRPPGVPLWSSLFHNLDDSGPYISMNVVASDRHLNTKSRFSHALSIELRNSSCTGVDFFTPMCMYMGVVSMQTGAKIKTMKFYSKGHGGNSTKFCTSENFPLYGIFVTATSKYNSHLVEV